MKKIIKRTAISFGILVSLILITGVVLYSIGMKKLNKTYSEIRVEEVKIPAGSEAVLRGKHIATIWACTRCHGDNLGGSIITKDPIDGYIPLLGTIPASNLTSGRGGIASTYADADWIRAIRHGVKPNGHIEVFMYDYSTMSEGDLGDLIAYLKQLPPVDSELPELNYGQLFPIFPALGIFTPVALKIDHNFLHPANTVPGENKEYGKYLSALCTSCHGGGPVASLKINFNKNDFVHSIRSGILPDGRHIDRPMPPRIYGEMNDTELAALWLYLQEQTFTANDNK